MYEQNKGKELAERIKREENMKLLEWMFAEQIGQSRRELSQWAYKENYK